VSNHSTKAAIPCPHTEHPGGYSQFSYEAGVLLRRRAARGTAPVNPSASSAQTMTAPPSLQPMKATQKQKRDRRVQAIKEGKVSKEYHIPKETTESKSDAPKVGPVASSTTKSKKKSPTVILDSDSSTDDSLTSHQSVASSTRSQSRARAEASSSQTPPRHASASSSRATRRPEASSQRADAKSQRADSTSKSQPHHDAPH